MVSITRPRACAQQRHQFGAGASGTGSGASAGGGFGAGDRSIDRKARAPDASTTPIAGRHQQRIGQPICAADPAPGERPDGQRAVLRQLVDRQRARAHPGRADELRGRLDGGIGGRPADAEQQHAEARPAANGATAPSSAMPAQENSEQPTTVVPRLNRPRTMRQQHARGDAADAHHPEDHAVHAGAELELLAHQQRQQRPGCGGGNGIGDGPDHRVLDRRRVAHEPHAGAHGGQQMLARQAGEAAAAAPGEQRSRSPRRSRRRTARTPGWSRRAGSGSRPAPGRRRGSG